VNRQLTHLTVSAAKAIHREVLKAHGGSSGIRDEALLESAMAAPQATMMGRPLISNPLDVAAAYLFYLCQNHPFVDGNKRTALASCLVFLEVNKVIGQQKLTADEWEAFVIAMASSEIDREETAKRLRKLIRR
jgi:death on curing protein